MSRDQDTVFSQQHTGRVGRKRKGKDVFKICVIALQHCYFHNNLHKNSISYFQQNLAFDIMNFLLPLSLVCFDFSILLHLILFSSIVCNVISGSILKKCVTISIVFVFAGQLQFFCKSHSYRHNQLFYSLFDKFIQNFIPVNLRGMQDSIIHILLMCFIYLNESTGFWLWNIRARRDF